MGRRTIKDITRDELKDLFEYDETTGLFTCKLQRGSRPAGIITGPISKNGYIEIEIYRKKYKAHRLAWLYVHGEFPNGMLDHKNGIKTDNRLSNLRIVSNTTNQHNNFKSKNGKLLGAFRQKQLNKWYAQITVNSKNIYLGLFDTEIAAHNKYMEAKRIYHADAY